MMMNTIDWKASNMGQVASVIWNLEGGISTSEIPHPKSISYALNGKDLR